MRAITKAQEPASLLAHRKTAECDYNNYARKDALRHALITEQRGICCYCMHRIHNGSATMKIEHWRCQSRYLDKQLNYHNLLAACRGADDQPRRLQHCDTSKGDQDVKYNPADPARRIEMRLSYAMDGSIQSDEADFDRQVNDVLNLNITILKNNRKSILYAILEWLQHEKQVRRRPVPRDRFERERARLTDGAGDLQPFCQVAVWWLDQRLARMTP